MATSSRESKTPLLAGSGATKSSRPLTDAAPLYSQYRALYRKNVTLQVRSKGTLCCQLSTPFVLVILLGGLQLWANTFSDKGKLQRPDPENYKFISSNPGEFLLYSTRQEDIVGTLPRDPTQAATGLLSYISTSNQTYKGELVRSPYFKMEDGRSELQTALTHEKQAWDKEASNKGLNDADKYVVASAALLFEHISVDPAKGNLSLQIEVMAEVQRGYPRFIDKDNGELLEVVYQLSAMQLAVNSYLQMMFGKDWQPWWSIQGNMVQIPYYDHTTVDLASLLAVLFFPLALSFLMPVYLFNVVLEKQERLREMQKMMGLNMSVYWLVTFLYDMFLYLIVLLIVVAGGYAFSFGIFADGSPAGNFILMFGWGIAQTSFSIFLTAFFNKTRTSTIFAYILVIVNVIVCSVLNGAVYIEFEEPPFYLFLYPPFAFYRGIYLLGVFCGFGQCPTWHDLTTSNKPGLAEFVPIYLYLYFTAIFWFMLGWYLDQVLPTEYGVARKPWFFLKSFEKFINPEKVERKRKAVTTLPQYTNSEASTMLIKPHYLDDAQAAEFVQGEDVDVRNERYRVYKRQVEEDTPVLLVDLHKKYTGRSGKGPKIAVKGLTLAIPKGECFGLLGPNGAGKTTSISMLTGLFPPSSGYAAVGGYNISTDMARAHRVMGVCPQFDTLWARLTCEETLLFYARLKGVPPKLEKEHVMHSLQQVGLDTVPTRLVGNLSGGMRRRLSVAVSLVGRPKIVFFDEPTTGLDPQSRRDLWNVLMEVKKDKAIILTTHSMEEADVLCTRIGIMANGALQCVGPQAHLKKRFGQGYTLRISYDATHEDTALSLIPKMLPKATIIEHFAGTCTYQVPREGVKVSEVFEAMVAKRQQYCIDDWGMSQTSLEDVFLRIVNEAQDEQ